MTRITFFKHDGLYLGFSCEGHTGYDEHGKDIVCAAVSALTQGTCLGISDVVGAKLTMRIDPEKGILKAMLDDGQDEDIIKTTQVLLETLEKALISIEQDSQYAGAIRITTRERR